MPKLSEFPVLDPAQVDGSELVGIVKAGTIYRTTVSTIGLAAALRAEAAAATAANLVASASGFANPDNLHAAMGNITGAPRVYNADPDKVIYFTSFFFDSLSGGRLVIVAVQADDEEGTNAEVVSEYNVQAGVAPSKNGIFQVPSVSSKGIYIDIPLDLSAYWTSQLYGGGTYADTGLSNKVIVNTQGWKDSVLQVIAEERADEDRRDEGPFHSLVTNDRLRDDISAIKGWFCLPGQQRYIVSAIELSDFSVALGYHRANITIRDRIQGVDVARASQLFHEDPTGTAQRVIAHQATLPSKSGQLFLIEIAATAQWTDGGSARLFTTFAESGLKESATASTAEVEGFLTNPVPDEIVTIDDDADGDFATLGAARDDSYNSTYQDAPEEQKYSVYPNSDRDDYPNKKGFLVLKAGHDEQMSGQANLPFEVLDGRSAFKTRFWNEQAGKRVMELTHSFYHRNYAFEQFVAEYGLHIDAAGANSSESQVGKAIQHFAILQVLEYVWGRAHGAEETNAAACIGMGISARQRLWLLAGLLEQVSGSPTPAMIMHNSPGMDEGGELRIARGQRLVAGPNVPALTLTGSWGESSRTEVFVSADSVVANGIKGNVPMLDTDPNMPAIARNRWPFIVRGAVTDGVAVEDEKMRVLQTAADTTLGGSTAVKVALFGRGYDAASGRGEALTLDGSTQALATKLNGLQGETMTFAKDGVGLDTITIGDYAGQSEDDVLAALNAQISPAFEISGVRIDGEIGVGT